MKFKYHRISWFSIVAAFIASPANADFTRIPFKYTSLTHLGYNGSLAHSRLGVNETADMIATFLRSQGASITSFGANRTKIIQTEADQVCEQWSNSIFRAEFETYETNSFRTFKKIERGQVPADCSTTKASWLQYGFSAIPLETGSGIQILATLDRSIDFSRPTTRVASSTIWGQYASAGAWSLVPSNATTRQNFETAFSIFVWRDNAESEVSVFAIGVPRSNGVEAAPHSTIGYAFRHVADGKIDSVAVQNVLSYVAQKSLLVP